MDVVLRADVKGLGKKGETLSVANGHARNFLLPRGLAMRASSGGAAQAEAMRRSAEVRDARLRGEAEEIARQLVGQTILVTGRAGASGKLFGSVTTTDVAAAIETQTGLVVDRHDLHLDEPIRAVGNHDVAARLHAEVAFVVTVEVVAG